MGLVCPPWRQNGARLPSPEGNLALFLPHIAKMGPDYPPWRAIWPQPPELEKKEGGKHFCLQGGQSGPICPILPHGAKKERGVNSAGILDLSRVDLNFFAGFQANGTVDLVFFKDNFFVN